MVTAANRRSESRHPMRTAPRTSRRQDLFPTTEVAGPGPNPAFPPEQWRRREPNLTPNCHTRGALLSALEPKRRTCNLGANTPFFHSPQILFNPPRSVFYGPDLEILKRTRTTVDRTFFSRCGYTLGAKPCSA